jgi:hypothetical protein
MQDGQALAMTSPWRPSNPFAAQDDSPAAAKKGQRFLLWIDAVGGYLFCLGERIVIGQSAPGMQADVGIQADISRRHAQITRLTDGYLIEPLAGLVTLQGRPIHNAALLPDDAEIGLGRSVQLRFRKPHALSSSARLEIVSGHRTAPHADGIILMAESCVLGPKRQDHIVCRDWTGDVVLYRSDDRLMCRSMVPLEIDGRTCEGRAAIQPGNHVVGADFSFSLETA